MIKNRGNPEFFYSRLATLFFFKQILNYEKLSENLKSSKILFREI